MSNVKLRLSREDKADPILRHTNLYTKSFIDFKGDLESKQQLKKEQDAATAANSKDAAKPKKHVHTRTTQSILYDFLLKKDVPKWFRGTSNFQLLASDQLFNALRDDAEQGSSHRVYACLESIGIFPLITERAIKTLMRLSRGNDLAFLWFLLELYYKTPGNKYTINEQLIMSAIAHLDIITTIRELNRILPPQLEKPKGPKPKPKCIPMGPVPEYNHKKKTNSPYFQTLPRPCHYGKSLLLKRPDFTVKLRNYAKYIDEKYVVQNEANRWYANYELQPGKRIVKKLLNTEIENIFEPPEVDNEADKRYVRKEIKKEIDRVVDMEEAADQEELTFVEYEMNEVVEQEDEHEKKKEERTLCEHHKVELEMENMLANELIVLARDRCLRMIDVDKRRREASQKRVLEQLDQDISLYMCKYRRWRSAGKKLIPIQLLICRGCDQCELEDMENDSCEENTKCDCLCEEGHPMEDPASLTHIEERSSGLRREPPPPGQPPMPKRFKCPKEPGVFFCRNGKHTKSSSEESAVDPLQPCKKSIRHSVQSLSRSPRISLVCNPMCQLCSDDTVRFDASTSSIHPSEHYFHGPSDNLPYRFDFHKIFTFKNEDEDIDIAKTFAEEMDETARSEAVRTNLPVRLHKACSNMVKKIWAENVELKIQEMKAEEERRKTIAEESPYIYPIAEYDPHDKELMDRMLKDAMLHMQQDRRFVLATMPDAHKLPLLREWIYLRYGKKYTQKERYQEFSLTIRIYYALSRVNNINVPFPTVASIGKNMNLNYSCRSYLHQKGQDLKREYRHKVDDAIMEQARVFWFAMRPYLWSIGPPRNTYFAYMPARIDDIIRFRLWKSNEFMDAKSVWEKRISANSTLRQG